VFLEHLKGSLQRCEKLLGTSNINEAALQLPDECSLSVDELVHLDDALVGVG
jgi:hypothetical protein